MGQRIAELREKVESADLEKTDDTEILGLIAEAQRGLSDLGSELPYVGTGLQSLDRVLREKLETIRARLAHRRQQYRLEQEITETIAYSAAERPADIVKFANGLDSYIKALPDEPRSQGFKLTRGEQTFWYNVEAWNKVVAGWKHQAGGLRFQEAKLRAEQCGRFLNDHPASVGTAEIAHYKQHAEAVARLCSQR